ncbi:unnamed protein product [Schistosoma margrebowiei]|uniref:Uncharacterized protein n=1 Tax=Schistosoma margrebowiei TaxID=48269 RepID=A0A183N3K9_9TREM|nr:unnamed protein product [Schistosoma margrebowiei]
MNTSTSEGKQGIQWTSRMQLDNLNFAGDLAPPTRTTPNTECNNPIIIDGEALEDVKPLHIWAVILVKTLSTQNTSDPLIRHYQQQPTMGENKPDSSGGSAQEEALEVDRTHIEENTQLCHKTSHLLESSMSKEKKNTKEHISPRNGDKYENNEQRLGRTRKKVPEQSELENAGQRTVLHWE